MYFNFRFRFSFAENYTVSQRTRLDVGFLSKKMLSAYEYVSNFVKFNPLELVFDTLIIYIIRGEHLYGTFRETEFSFSDE